MKKPVKFAVVLVALFVGIALFAQEVQEAEAAQVVEGVQEVKEPLTPPNWTFEEYQSDVDGFFAAWLEFFDAAGVNLNEISRKNLENPPGSDVGFVLNFGDLPISFAGLDVLAVMNVRAYMAQSLPEVNVVWPEQVNSSIEFVAGHDTVHITNVLFYGVAEKTMPLPVRKGILPSSGTLNLLIGGGGSVNFYGVSVGLSSKTFQTVNGIQLTAFSNRTVKFNGLQASISNNAIHYGNGIQLGVFRNRADRFSGLQVALDNTAQKANGIQIGLDNTTFKLNGMQVGFDNNAVSTGCGLQIGVANTSGKDSGFGIQIGLTNNNGRYSLPLINIVY